jgi:pyruvate kinase
MKFLYTLKRSTPLETLERYVQLGASAFRVNFGRGSVEENAECVDRAAQLENVEVFLDLPGFKPRLDKYEKGRESYRQGETILLADQAAICGHSVCALSNDTSADYAVGDRIVTSSGLKWQVCAQTPRGWELRALNDGDLYSYCGFFNANKLRRRTSLSAQERQFSARLQDIRGKNLVGICPSFADTAQVPLETRQLFPGKRILSKIETPYGVENLSSILEESDGLMLCRGDLSMFYAEEEMYSLGKQMAQACHAGAGKTFIAATDFFSHFVHDAGAMEEDLPLLEAYIALNPEYILINETAYCPEWEQIVKKCQEYV